MKFKNKVRVSMEALKHRYDEKFVTDLVAGFQYLLDAKNYSRKEIVASNIETLIKDTTGLNVYLEVEDSPLPNMYIVPPDLKTNHSMHSKVTRKFTTGKDAIKWLRGNPGKTLEGTVDRTKGVVTGVFATLPIKAVIFSALFKHIGKQPPVAEEIAAGFLHEIGHAFTYFENLDRAYTVDMVLSTVIQEFAKTDDTIIHNNLLEAGAGALGSKVIDYDTPLDSKSSGEVITAVLINGAADNPESMLFSYIHDMRNWEQSSDQFVSRLGMGAPLARMLDKTNLVDFSKQSVPTWFLVNAFISGSTLFYSPIIVPLLLLMGLTPDANLYDGLPARIKRLRQDVISSLKDDKLATGDVKRILKDLEEIDHVMGPLTERELFSSKLLRFIVSPWKTQKQLMDKQKQLEELANNELFVTSAKFRSISLADGSSAHGSNEEDELVATIESLGASLETIIVAKEELSALGMESHVASLNNISTEGLVSSLADMLRSLFDMIVNFFMGGSTSAKSYQSTIEEIAEAAPQASIGDVESSDYIQDKLSVPIVMIAFSPKSLPKTAKFVEKIAGLVLNASTIHFNDIVLGGVDKNLDKIDHMTSDQRQEQLSRLTDHLHEVKTASKEFPAIASELGIELVHADVADLSNTQANKQFIQLLSALSTSNKHIDVGTAFAGVSNINWKKTIQLADYTTTQLCKLKLTEKTVKIQRTALKNLEARAKDLDQQDHSVRYYKEYIDAQKSTCTITLKASKVLLVQIRGQRDIANSVQAIAKETKK